MNRVLVTGWFTVDGGEATAGDLLAMEEVRDVLRGAGADVSVVTNAGFPDGTRLGDVDPDAVDCLVFVCGPLHGDRVGRLVDRFPAARKVAVNVSAVDPDLAARFDVVLARDGGARDGRPAAHAAAPDITLLRRPPRLPVVGVVRAHPQPEYRGAAHARADDAVRLLLASRPCAVVDFDTRVHPSADPLAAHARHPAEVTSLAGRMDAVVSTRLHGMVLALGQGVPVVAIDPVAGGAKVTAQASALDWPCCFAVDDLHPEHLAEALTWSLTSEARSLAAAVADRARDRLGPLPDRIVAAVTTDGAADGRDAG